jgi:phenylacetate-CoA ligase
MPDSARRLITEQHGIPIFSSYEANEATCLAFECEQHDGLHVNIDLSPVRIVDEDGHTLPEGDSGNVVISNLILRGTMMLNYMLQDVAAWQPGSCACGRTLPRLGRLVGRLDDWIALPSGRRVHPHVIPGLMFKGEGVWQYQVTQESTNHLRVAIVPAEGVDREAMRQRLLTRFADSFGGEVEADVVYVDDVERTARGKIRPVISLQTRGWLDRAGDSTPVS